MFGFGKSKSVEAVPPVRVPVPAHVPTPAEARDEVFERVLRFYINNKLTFDGMRVQWDKNVTVGSKNQVNKLVRQLENKTVESLERCFKEGEEFIARQAVIARVMNDVNEEQASIIRGRALVKAFRAGLTDSPVYVKLMEETKVEELVKLERWIDSSNAYQFYLETV